jgi:chaperonin GroES
LKLKMLEDRILVRRIEAPTQSRGGIIIPDQYQEKATEAEALVVGPGFWLENGTHREMGVAVGDRVLLGKYAGSEIAIDGEALVIIRESDVLGVIVVKGKG